MSKKFIDTSENSIGQYLKDVRKLDMVSAEEELELAKKILEGDESAKKYLIQANLRFVISVAKEYQGQGVPLSDLINEGNFGLTKAAGRFDHTRGFRFISYAVWWIKQSILQCLNETSRTVRLPVNITNEMMKIRKQMAKFEQEYGRDVTHVDTLIDTKGNELNIATLNQPTCGSLNSPINEEGDEILDLIADDSYALPGDDVYNEDVLKDEMDKTLSVLSDRERKIIEMYFGLDGQAMTLEQIGGEYNLTKERIRQIKEKALRQLKNSCDNLMEFMYK